MTEPEALFMGLYYIGQAGFNPNTVKFGEGSSKHLTCDDETAHKAYQILSRRDADITLGQCRTAFLGRPAKQALMITMWLIEKVDVGEYMDALKNWNNDNPRKP